MNWEQDTIGLSLILSANKDTGTLTINHNKRSVRTILDRFLW